VIIVAVALAMPGAISPIAEQAAKYPIDVKRLHAGERCQLPEPEGPQPPRKLSVVDRVTGKEPEGCFVFGGWEDGSLIGTCNGGAM